MEFIAGSSNRSLAFKIAKLCGKALVDVAIGKFPNGEKRILIKEPIRAKDIAVIQSFFPSVDEKIMETLLMIDAVKRMGAGKIYLAVPWLGYALQNRVFLKGEPLSAKVIAGLLSTSGVNAIVFLDLHQENVLRYFSVPVCHLRAVNLFADYLKQNLKLGGSVVVSPDQGGGKQAGVLAARLKLPLIKMKKQRDLTTGKTQASWLKGEVKDKTVILFDDGIITGGTLAGAAKLLQKKGAKKIYFLATHGLFSQSSLEKLARSSAEAIIVTNSLNHLAGPKIKSLDIAPLFAKALLGWSGGKER
jgi:ribose-phosphate pyrophosphokinase